MSNKPEITKNSLAKSLERICSLCPVVNQARKSSGHKTFAQAAPIMRPIYKALEADREVLLLDMQASTWSVEISKIDIRCEVLQEFKGCKRNCGVISPLEFLHDDVSFTNLRQRKAQNREYDANLTSANSVLVQLPFPQAFADACYEISRNDGTSFWIAAAFIISAVATVCQEKLSFTLGDGKRHLVRFFPVAIRQTQDEKMDEILHRAFAPLLNHQENKNEEIREIVCQRKKRIAALRYKRSIKVVSSREYNTICKEINVLSGMRDRFSFVIEEKTPMKFFKQQKIHAESCVIVDSNGEFFDRLHKSSHGVQDLIRFLTAQDAVRTFQFYDQYGQRHRVAQRDLFFVSVVTRKQYELLRKKRGSYYSALSDLLFPLTPEPGFPPSKLQSTPAYNRRMAELINNIENAAPLVYRISRHTPCPLFRGKLCPPEFEVLCNMMSLYVNIYEQLTLSPPGNNESGGALALTLLGSRENFHLDSQLNTAAKNALRIKNYLNRKKLRYFRLRTLQHDLLSNLKKNEILEAIEWMIEEGDARKVRPILKIPRSYRSGQLYIIDLDELMPGENTESTMPYVNQLPAPPDGWKPNK